MAIDDILITRAWMLDRGTPSGPLTSDGVGLLTLPGTNTPGCQDGQGNLYAIPATPWLSTSSSDTAPALNAAITTAAARGLGYVEAPGGALPIKSNVIWSSPGVRVIGRGYGSTRFVIDDTGGNIGNAFRCINQPYCSLEQATISALSQRTAGYAVNVSGGDSTVGLVGTNFGRNGFVLDVDMDLQFNGVLVNDGPGSVGCWGVTIGTGRKAFWRDFNTSGQALLLASPLGATHVIRGIFAKCENASPALAAFHVTGSGDFRLTECDSLGFKNAFLIDNSGNFATQGGSPAGSTGIIMGCEFDNTEGAVNSDCFRVFPTATAGQLHMQILGTWFASGYNGAYINMNGSTPVGWRFTFQGCTFNGNNQYGLHGTNGATQDTGSGGTIQVPLTTNTFDGNGVGTTSFV